MKKFLIYFLINLVLALTSCTKKPLEQPASSSHTATLIWSNASFHNRMYYINGTLMADHITSQTVSFKINSGDVIKMEVLSGLDNFFTIQIDGTQVLRQETTNTQDASVMYTVK